ncbi:MAG TPA: VPLPA-CTERM sorting domain-containing protein [Sedimentisphaerales bacterium]
MNTKIAGLVFGALIAVNVPAQAVTDQEDVINYAGIVSSGVDSAGLFGSVGADLTSVNYTSLFLFDPDLGGSIVRTPTEESNIGGSNFGSVSPALYAALTINGHTVAIGGNYAGIIDGYFSGVQTIQTHYVAPDANEYLFNYIESQSGGLSISLDYGFSYIVVSGDVVSGGFSFGGDVLVLAPQAVVENVLAIDPGVTPLPAALPLFATGLGAMGLLGWRRKRKNAAAIAAA